MSYCISHRDGRRARKCSIVFSLACTLFLTGCGVAQPLANAPAPPQPVRLTILCPDGRPASGATVAFPFYYFTGDLNPPPDPQTPQFPKYQADAHGIVSIPASNGQQKLVVAHSTGCTELGPDIWTRGGSVRLRAWARIDGKLTLRGRPSSGQYVEAFGAFDPGDQQLSFAIKSRTAADGSFAIERVPPVGAAYVERFSESVGVAFPWTKINVDAGQTTRPAVGNTGGFVVGRLEAPPALVDRHDSLYSGDIIHQEIPPRLPMPDDVRNGTFEQRKKWNAEFTKTDKFKTWSAAAQNALNAFRGYPMEINADGTFCIEDVSAGTYELEVRICRSSDLNWMSDLGSPIAMGGSRFLVPTMPGGRSDEPLQLPPIALHSVELAVLGQTAPDFTAPRLTQGSLKLSDFRGRYVLLDFWSTSCGYCIKEFPSLRAVNDEFGKTGRLAIISLSADEKSADALAYVQKQDLQWDQVWIGDDAGQLVSERYGDATPNILLIAPDGRIIATDLRGDQIRAAVAANLNGASKGN